MFILKKIISQFLMPVPLILSIFLVGLVLLWFTKKQKAGKIFVSVGLFLFLLLSYDAISSHLLELLENTYAPDKIQLVNKASSEERRPIKFVVVLGGGHTTNPTLPITSQIGEDSLVRLIEGIRLYRKIPGAKLILSGGRGFDPVSNADVMANLARDLGVDDNDIILETKSKDTAEESNFIKTAVINDRFILVTSASHMPRSIAMFKKMGMNPIPAPTGHLDKSGQYLSPYSFFPGAGNLLKSERAVHEYIGMGWATLRSQI